MPFTLPVSFFSQDSATTTDYTVTYSIAPDVGTFSSTSSLSQDGTKSISADGITFTSNNSNIVADCAKIQLDTDRDEYRDVTVTLTITDGIKTKTVTKVLTGISAFSVSNLNQTIFTNEDVNPTVTTMVVTDASDVSATGDVTATITNSDPSAATLSSSAGTYNSTTGVYTITDSIANVNTALAALSVALTANFNGNFTLTTAFNDTGSVHTASGLIDITVISINDAPAIASLSDKQYDIYSLASLNFADAVTVTDADNDTLSATLTLSDTSIGSLSFPNGTYNAVTGVWTYSNPPSNLQTILRGATFIPAGSQLGRGNIAFSITDGVASAATGTVNLRPTDEIRASLASAFTVSANMNKVSNMTSSVSIQSTIGASMLAAAIIESIVPATTTISTTVTGISNMPSTVNATTTVGLLLNSTSNLPSGVASTLGVGASIATDSSIDVAASFVNVAETKVLTASAVKTGTFSNSFGTSSTASSATASSTQNIDRTNFDTFFSGTTTSGSNTTGFKVTRAGVEHTLATTITGGTTSPEFAISHNGEVVAVPKTEGFNIYQWNGSAYALHQTFSVPSSAFQKSCMSGDGLVIYFAAIGTSTIALGLDGLQQMRRATTSNNFAVGFAGVNVAHCNTSPMTNTDGTVVAVGWNHNTGTSGTRLKVYRFSGGGAGIGAGTLTEEKTVDDSSKLLTATDISPDGNNVLATGGLLRYDTSSTTWTQTNIVGNVCVGDNLLPTGTTIIKIT